MSWTFQKLLAIEKGYTVIKMGCSRDEHVECVGNFPS